MEGVGGHRGLARRGRQGRSMVLPLQSAQSAGCVAAVHEMHPAGEIREVGRLLDGRVAAPHDHQRLVAEPRQVAVAEGAGAHAPVLEILGDAAPSSVDVFDGRVAISRFLCPKMTRCAMSLGNWLKNWACSIRRSSPNGEGGILSRLFSTVSEFLRFLTQCPCPSTTCDRWLVLGRSGSFRSKSGPFSKVSAKSSGAMPERVALSARACGDARTGTVVPPPAAKGGAS